MLSRPGGSEGEDGRSDEEARREGEKKGEEGREGGREGGREHVEEKADSAGLQMQRVRSAQRCSRGLLLQPRLVR
eukprot:505399-Hanusia_phi.AAC.1